ncbi:MAG: DnaJ domain-containing protein [Actinobacteria bacterium]|nr:DnaJ domain-containing protein [Actinomycetota bacterium]
MSVRQWRLNDYYSVLGVSPGASDEEIDTAFRALAKRWHPDRCAGDADAAERFKEITAAHDVIGDPRRRLAYDRERALSAASPTARPAPMAATDATAGPSAAPAGGATEATGERPRPDARSDAWADWTAPPPAPARRPRRFHPALVLCIGAILFAAGVLLAGWRLTVGRAGASFGTAAVHTSGVVVDVNGRSDVRFQTTAGTVVTARPAGRATDSAGSSVRVVYDRGDPSRVVVDHDSFAKEFTIWFAAVKLIVGGAALMVVARSRRLRAWLVEHTRSQRRQQLARTGA